MINTRTLLLLLLAAVLSACATGPKYDVSGIDLSHTPQAVVEGKVPQGIEVLWGGIIISSANLKAVTQFEILAYPLDSNQRPLVAKMPLGRFLAQQQDYLEINDYVQGRLITVGGLVQGKSIGKIGESEYTYPVVNINKHYLWARPGEGPESNVHFGFGVMIHN